MILLAVDIGNHRVKYANAAEIPRTLPNPAATPPVPAILHLDRAPENGLLDDAPASWIAASVNRSCTQKWKDWLDRYRPQDHVHLVDERDVPLASQVVSRRRLGIDRLVAAYAATKLPLPGGARLVIDAGTAVTVDFVDPDQRFRGGVIFPGPHTLFRALSDMTDALPDLSDEPFLPAVEAAGDAGQLENLLGDSTESAIRLGVAHMQIGTLERLASAYRRLYPEIATIVTGGAGFSLVRALDPTPLWIPDLVLRGCVDVAQHLKLPGSDPSDGAG